MRLRGFSLGELKKRLRNENKRDCKKGGYQLKITKEIAEKNVGRYYDRYNRYCCGAYPRQIIRFSDGSLAFKRIVDGVCSPFYFENERDSEYADYFFDSLDKCKVEV